MDVVVAAGCVGESGTRPINRIGTEDSIDDETEMVVLWLCPSNSKSTEKSNSLVIVPLVNIAKYQLVLAEGVQGLDGLEFQIEVESTEIVDQLDSSNVHNGHLVGVLIMLFILQSSREQ